MVVIFLTRILRFIIKRIKLSSKLRAKHVYAGRLKEDPDRVNRIGLRVVKVSRACFTNPNRYIGCIYCCLVYDENSHSFIHV